MKAVLHVNRAEHQRKHGAAMKAGLERHGWSVEVAAYDEPAACDLAVVWGYRQPRVIKSAPRLLVMEAGHVQLRLEWASCGFDGLAGRGVYPEPQDQGERWQRYFAHHLRPWRDGGDYALLLGQCPGDASLYGLTEGFPAWAQRMTDALAARGHRVVYRPHPLMARRGDPFCPKGAERSHGGSLEDDLAGAAVAVTYNSTAGVEAALAGVPVIACDAGSMARPVAAHGVDEALVRPDRREWCRRLAWTQWRLDEITDGTAWEALKTCLH